MSLSNKIPNGERGISAIIGAGTGLHEMMQTLRKAAPSDSTVLLLGETGTGKELLAQALHFLSNRSKGPFVAVHCAALVKTLLESELFGHEKGAFTGADQVRLGRFELAKGGSIFLDEIGEIPADTQVKLLRVLQEREIQRVGGNQLIPIDVRLIAATHKNLKEEVQEGNFREDLYFRLNVIPIRVPPLRERKQDIPELAQFFLQKYSQKNGMTLSLSPEALEHLIHYEWPGNVRELENVMERVVILHTSSVIEPKDLRLNLQETQTMDDVDLEGILSGGPVLQKVQQVEAKNLSQALFRAKGNVSEAARLLGIPRTNLFRRLKKYKLI